jgi:flagellar basal-body rod protein FlgB
MFDAMFNSGAMRATEHTLAFTEKRHNLLAGNVANMDTPGYQTRDLSVENFQQALKASLPNSPEDLPQYSSMANAHRIQSSPRHLLTQSLLVSNENSLAQAEDLTTENDPVAEATRNTEQIRDAMTQVLYHDASDVSMEEQVTEISKNSGLHSTTVSLMRNQFRTLKMAIAGSVNV